jgi:AcrR family transcriptional regulator
MTSPEPIPEPLVVGLRERKKAQTRRAISDAATRLFVERGFDDVTLAEVAEAADVSIKTIFNHFGSKEELFLDREAELQDGVLSAVSGRPAGRTVTEALAELLGGHRLPVPGEDWSTLRDPERYELFRRFLETWSASPALRGRSLLWHQRLQGDLARLVARESGRPADDDAVRAMAAMLTAAALLRHATLASSVLEGLPAAEVERRVRAVVTEAFGRVAAAFPDLDLRAGPGREGQGPAPR